MRFVYHHRRCRVLACWLALLALLPAGLSAKSPASRVPPLEQAIGRASLILVARVGEVGESKVVYGGKAERVIRTFEFEPVQTLKGVFVRDLLALTSEDLGNYVWNPMVDSVGLPESGQLRLLLLGRSGTGYQNVHNRPTLEQSLPALESTSDPLVRTVQKLIAVTQEHDRARKVDLLLSGIQGARGTAAVPLLDSLAYRAMLVAQHARAASITRLLGDPSPETRAAAAQTLGAVLEADYLENGELAEQAVKGLVALLETSDRFVAARVAALDAIGVARSQAVPDIAAGQLRLGLPRSTWVEEAAAIEAIGRQHLAPFTSQLLALAEEMELDAVPEFGQAVHSTLIRLDPARAARLIERRIDDIHLAGLDAAVEIQLAGELPVEEGVSVLTSVSPKALSGAEKLAFAGASQKLKDARLIPALASLLEPRFPIVHRQVVEALRKIDTDRAAEALRPYLPQEANLERKLEIAAFLGRHGIDTGTSYALEHMSQAELLEPSLAVLVAVSGRETVDTLRRIVATSNDIAWTGAAMRALGALHDRDLAPRLLGIAEDLRDPLAPYALVALGDLGEPKVTEILRAAARSRDDRIVVASIRGAGNLLKQKRVDDPSFRDEIAALLASSDSSYEVRVAALHVLRELEDPRLDKALASAVLDAQLEGTPLLAQLDELAEKRKIRLAI